MDRATVWLVMYQASLIGLLAAETPERHFDSRAKAAEAAGIQADFSMGEYDRRFSKPVQPPRVVV